jgi:hypothetical protein
MVYLIRLGSHSERSFAIYGLNIQINVLIIQRTTCLHSQRPMLSIPISPGFIRFAYPSNPANLLSFFTIHRRKILWHTYFLPSSDIFYTITIVVTPFSLHSLLPPILIAILSSPVNEKRIRKKSDPFVRKNRA